MLNNNPSPGSVADLSVAGSCMLTKQQPLTSSPFYKKPDQGLPLFDLLAFFTSSSAAITSLSLRNSPAAFATFRLVQNTINSICWHSSSSSLSFLQQDNKYWSSKQHTNIPQYQYLINIVPFSNFFKQLLSFSKPKDMTVSNHKAWAEQFLFSVFALKLEIFDFANRIILAKLVHEYADT